MSLKNKTILVLGASGGIGSAVCHLLAGHGAHLVCASRPSDRLQTIASQSGGFAIELDATDPRQMDAAVEAAANRLGRLDGAVNCVGSLLLKPAHLTTDEEWANTIATNLNSSFYLLRSAAKRMQQDGGSLVLISTAAARTGLANHEAIAAAKGGVLGLALSAAASYAPRGIRVNCVAPGLVETQLTARITSRESSRKASVDMHALGKLGTPGDVARAVTWLLDPDQSWVTGQVIGVDGGLGTIRSR